MIVVVTGTPGTGKTTVSRYIAEQTNYTYIDGNDFITDDTCMGYDDDRDCKVVNLEKWCEAIQRHIEDNKVEHAVIDSHLSHDLPIELVDFCIVTVCDRITLQQRLLERGYKQEKIQENLQAEIMDVCAVEAQEHGHKIYKVDTTRDSWKEHIIQLLFGKK